jgi:hypothetical protein
MMSYYSQIQISPLQKLEGGGCDDERMHSLREIISPGGHIFTQSSKFSDPSLSCTIHEATSERNVIFFFEDISQH